MPFVKGESGNPAGRPSGARNTKTLLREAMLDADGDDLTKAMISRALAGDSTALRLCMERVLPRGANRPIAFELPRIDSAEAARQAVADVVAAMARAELAPREASEMLRVIERGAKIIATAETADAAAREGQPRHIEVTWVDPKEKEGEMADLLEAEIPGGLRGAVRPAARPAGPGGRHAAAGEGAGGGCPDRRPRGRGRPAARSGSWAATTGCDGRRWRREQWKQRKYNRRAAEEAIAASGPARAIPLRLDGQGRGGRIAGWRGAGVRGPARLAVPRREAACP